MEAYDIHGPEEQAIRGEQVQGGGGGMVELELVTRPSYSRSSVERNVEDLLENLSPKNSEQIEV